MNRPIRIELFVEDSVHEHLLCPLIERICKDKSTQADLQIRNARGGHGRTIQEFKTYLQVRDRIAGQPTPDMVIVGIDGNCDSPAKTKSRIESALDSNLPFEVVYACPDPHVERWFFADLNTFERVIGARPGLSSRKCTRDYYKAHLHRAVLQGGHPSTLGGLEFAQELANGMDLFVADRTDSSFKAFHSDLSASLSFLNPADSGVA